MIEYTFTDTIAAIATPVGGSGGVGIIRISGPDAAGVLCRLVGVSETSLTPRYLAFGRVRGEKGILDEVLYVYMPGPRTFTGEDVAEIHGHGGTANMGALLRATFAAGARPAKAGEFSRRAFENGRMELTEAEAIGDVIRATSDRALQIAQRQLQGGLSRVLGELRSTVTGTLAQLEAAIDFPDEDLDIRIQEEYLKTIDDAARQSAELAATYGAGRAIRDGLDVAIRGAVNAGKSSLFNALIDTDRSIVSAEPGTTRDYVEAQVNWNGITVTLVDTAGDRTATSAVEHQGMELGQKRAQGADVELVVVPADDLDSLPRVGPRQMLVVSKCDLISEIFTLPPDAVQTSSATGVGLAALREKILSRLLGSYSDLGEGIVITSERQRAHLEDARVSLTAAYGLLAEKRELELVAMELRSALDSLGQVSGEGVGDDVLDALFAQFCIGK